MKRWRLLAWNIRAGGGARADRIIGAVHDLSPDAVILSEYRDTPASQQIAQALRAAGLPHQNTTTAEVRPAGNALLIAARSPMRRVALRRYPREPGRWRMVRLQQLPITVAGMHVPNQHTGRKPAYHDAVIELMRRWRGGPAILAGDTNSGRSGEDEQTQVFNRRTTQWFDDIHSTGWRDAFRLVHGAKREYTWYSPGHDNGFRLDQAFVSPQLASRVLDARHIWVGAEQPAARRSGVSDHAALILDLDIQGLG